jgi:DNA-binding HxlR family transcriptional regulator
MRTTVNSQVREKIKEDFFRFLINENTRQILEFISGNGNTRHKEMMSCINLYFLSTKLGKLLASGLICHHFERTDRRREWYTLTDKGRRVLECLHTLEDYMRDGSVQEGE